MAAPEFWADGVAGTTIGITDWNRTALVTDWSGGRLLAFTNGHLEPWGDGYDEPEGVVSIGNDEALIVERTGTLLRQNLLAPGRAHATVVATGLGAAHGVAVDDDGATAFVTDYAGGRVLAIDLADGVSTVRASGLGRPVGVVVGADGELYVSDQAQGRIVRVDPDGSTAQVLGGLVAPFLLSWADAERTRLLVPERSPLHRVGIVDLTADIPALVPLVRWGVRQPSQALVIGDRLVIPGQSRVLAVDVTNGLEPRVALEVPDGPLWPGSWADVPVDTGVTGLTVDELEIVSTSPDLVGIDLHPADDADPRRPQIRLLAGVQSGETDIVARVKATGEEVGTARVEVGIPPRPVGDGPSAWMDSPGGPLLLHTLSGGVSEAGRLIPRDLAGNRLPAWRVLAVLVDTGDAEWPDVVPLGSPIQTAAQARAAWRTTLTGARGVDAFYREISNARLGVDLRTGAVLGPVHLGGTWTDWFSLDSDGDWAATAEVFPRVVDGIRNAPGVNWAEVDCVFMVVRSSAGRFVWPSASIGKTRWAAVPGGVIPFPVPRNFSVVNMPDRSTLSFTDVEVSAHEIGHTLGLDDLYMTSGFSSGMAPRDLGRRELMSDQSNLPHLCTRNKLLLGFLDAAHVRSFQAGIAETAVPITLSAISSGVPAANTFAAIELSAGDGRSWFFEYRAPVPGRLGDAGGVFGAGRVIGYDALSHEDPPVVADARRPVIMLRDDGDGEGASLVAGEDYETLDPEGTQAPLWFRLEVVSTGATTANVLVTTGPAPRPDPAVTRAPLGGYVSPSIEVRNDVIENLKTGIFPITFTNVPVAGVVNRIVTKVDNGGAADAPGVVVDVSVLPFNTDGPNSPRWDHVGEAEVDVPAGQMREAVVEWNPETTGHWCVQTRLRHYRPAAPAPEEISIYNNEAQTNYDVLISVVESPARRVARRIEVFNPLDRVVDAIVEVTHDSDQYRCFIDHQWLRLRPREVRTVTLEVESKATQPWQTAEGLFRDATTTVRTWLPSSRCAPGTGFPVGVRTITAVRTTARVVEAGERMVYVAFEAPALGTVVWTGDAVLMVAYKDGSEEVVHADVENGFAGFEVRPEPWTATLYYSGGQGFAPILGEPISSPW
ncbi:MAG TPA: hypothetical protein PKE40_09405 [Arachnia sp.]|nr:hypothetical protein [Arachnia sp.]HMT86556.1 hypothetical protein [Arachnia sp.]